MKFYKNVIKLENLHNNLLIRCYMILHIVSFKGKRVPLLLEELLVLISQGLRSFASPSDDDLGTLPGTELPLILLPCNLNYALQDQLS